MVLTKFSVGDKVLKVGGNYSAVGEIRAAFTNKFGDDRYVFEYEALPGMLHIFSGSQLQRDVGNHD
jgi:hypothetical protein